jgi:hypothetical protein
MRCVCATSELKNQKQKKNSADISRQTCFSLKFVTWTLALSCKILANPAQKHAKRLKTESETSTWPLRGGRAQLRMRDTARGRAQLRMRDTANRVRVLVQTVVTRST